MKLGEILKTILIIVMIMVFVCGIIFIRDNALLICNVDNETIVYAGHYPSNFEKLTKDVNYPDGYFIYDTYILKNGLFEDAPGISNVINKSECIKVLVSQNIVHTEEKDV